MQPVLVGTDCGFSLSLRFIIDTLVLLLDLAYNPAINFIAIVPMTTQQSDTDNSLHTPMMQQYLSPSKRSIRMSWCFIAWAIFYEYF